MTHAYSCLLTSYVIMTHTDGNRVIRLFNTNTVYYYINPSLPSLYGRLDFFQFTAFQSHPIGNSWVVPKEGLHLFASHRRGPSYFASHPLVVVDDLAFPLKPVLSTARLGTCASPY